MKSRLANAASERLATALADEPVMNEDEVLRVLARIARHGKPSDRLRAAELIGRRLGMFSEKNEPAGHVTLEQLVPKRIPRPPVNAEILKKEESTSS
jgi:hypothetical protein